MKKNIVAVVILFSSVVALGASAPVRAQPLGRNTNTIGPALSIGGGQTVFGIDSRFGIADNLSLRPFIQFPSGGTIFGSSLTYDFNTTRTEKIQITPFVGGGVAIASGGNNNTQAYLAGGADFGVTDNIELKAELDIPLSSNNSSTSVTLGAGFKF